MNRSKKKIIHCIAYCVDCGKEWQQYKTARKNAYAHSLKTGHTVQVEIGSTFTYNPK